MFGMSGTELVIVMLVALLLLGPQKLPELARSLGKGMRDFKKATEDVRTTVESEFYKLDQPPPQIPQPYQPPPIPQPYQAPPPALAESAAGAPALAPPAVPVPVPVAQAAAPAPAAAVAPQAVPAHPPADASASAAPASVPDAAPKA